MPNERKMPHKSTTCRASVSHIGKNMHEIVNR